MAATCAWSSVARWSRPRSRPSRRGEDLRERVGKHLTTLPLAPPDAEASTALELLAWMVAGGHLDVKVAVPCDTGGKPVNDSAIFHEKAGIIEDRGGDKIAWNGSLNETAAGWRRNWESINVYTSWGPEPGRVADEEANFARIWANKAQRVIVLDVPEAARRDLMRFLPASDMPARLKDARGRNRFSALRINAGSPADGARDPGGRWIGRSEKPRVVFHPARTHLARGRRERRRSNDGDHTPWPHQVKAFERLYRDWPPKLLDRR